jgi:hypothetical protein
MTSGTRAWLLLDMLAEVRRVVGDFAPDYDCLLLGLEGREKRRGPVVIVWLEGLPVSLIMMSQYYLLY